MGELRTGRGIVAAQDNVSSAVSRTSENSRILEDFRILCDKIREQLRSTAEDILLPRCSPLGSTNLIERLESRLFLSSVNIDVSQLVRGVETNLRGVNVATWDGVLSNAATKPLVQNAGVDMIRMPGGSTTEKWHFFFA